MSASEVDAQEAARLELVLEAYQLIDINLTKDPFRKPPDLNSRRLLSGWSSLRQTACLDGRAAVVLEAEQPLARGEEVARVPSLVIA